MRTCLFIIALVAAISWHHRAVAQSLTASDDPLRRGHALIIGNSTYKDTRWPRLDDVALQVAALEKGLKSHFDKVEVMQNLETDQLRQKINSFVRSHGNDRNARLFIYYAGHGYTELIGERNTYRGYITGTDTPAIDPAKSDYAVARLRAISMTEIRALLEDVLAKHILFVFDSCFAGTIFTSRAGGDPPQPLTPDTVARLLEKPARDFITAGTADQRVPAHSPIPALLLAALEGEADPYKHGVVSAAEIRAYLLDRVLRMQGINLTPQHGSLPDPVFAQGSFLFRVIGPGRPATRAPDEAETVRLYRVNAAKGDARAQVDLGYMYSQGVGGVPQDDREAARLYRLAADQGNADAQNNLGFYYEHRPRRPPEGRPRSCASLPARRRSGQRPRPGQSRFILRQRPRRPPEG